MAVYPTLICAFRSIWRRVDGRSRARTRLSFTGCPVSLRWKIKMGPSATVPFASRSPSNESLNTPQRLASFDGHRGRRKRGNGTARGTRRKSVEERTTPMGTLIEQFAHVPWNSKNLHRRLTMYRTGTEAVLRVNKLTDWTWPCFAPNDAPQVFRWVQPRLCELMSGILR